VETLSCLSSSQEAWEVGSFVGRVLINFLVQPPVIDDESKVEKEAGSPPQEKAPQDSCEIVSRPFSAFSLQAISRAISHTPHSK
jgi:hypothetical protein